MIEHVLECHARLQPYQAQLVTQHRIGARLWRNPCHLPIGIGLLLQGPYKIRDPNGIGRIGQQNNARAMLSIAARAIKVSRIKFPDALQPPGMIVFQSCGADGQTQ